MNKYLCYIFFDENWSAYYVGKGSNKKRIRQRHGVIIPPDERVQVFYFANEWEAFECERELIAFWGRECDGGCLQNKSVGGSNGPIGCKFVFTEKHKRKIGDFRKGKKQSNEHMIALKRKALTLRNVITNEVRTFASHREAMREVGIHRTNLKERGISKGWELVG